MWYTVTADNGVTKWVNMSCHGVIRDKSWEARVVAQLSSVNALKVSKIYEKSASSSFIPILKWSWNESTNVVKNLVLSSGRTNVIHLPQMKGAGTAHV